MNSSSELKNVLITGSTSGIGLRTAEILMQSKKFKVIIASRNAEKVQHVVNNLKEKFGDAVVGYALDVSSLKAVSDFADQFKKDFKTLHSLVLNAGVANFKLEISAEGFESTFATNVLGHYYLVELLLPMLTASPSRIVVVASGVHDPDSGAGFNSRFFISF